VEWKLDLLQGRDTLSVSKKIAVGVVMAHGCYPDAQPDAPEDDGIPLYGLTPSMEKTFSCLEARMGTAPVTVGNSIKEIPMMVTAGSCFGVALGTGNTVSDAREKAYNVAWKIKPPTNRMFRTDIGCRLEKQLPELQKNGFASDMEYE
jgi:phosphoribosylamine-glycine ligase